MTLHRLLMRTAKEIIEAIEEFAPLSNQEGWDNSGLQVGNPEIFVDSALVGLDPTYEIICEARDRGIKLVITHHPLIFKGIKRITEDDPTGRCIIEAIRNGIVIYSTHTASDKVADGVSGAAAKMLGLHDVSILESDKDPHVGLGVIGNLPHPMKDEEFIKYVKQCLDVKNVRTSRPVGKEISKVAFCGGSGGSLIGSAIDAGADAYISADIKYHDFFTGDALLIVDPGHFETEAQIMKVFVEVVKKKFPNFAVLIGEQIHNPVYYY